MNVLISLLLSQDRSRVLDDDLEDGNEDLKQRNDSGPNFCVFYTSWQRSASSPSHREQPSPLTFVNLFKEEKDKERSKEKFEPGAGRKEDAREEQSWSW